MLRFVIGGCLLDLFKSKQQLIFEQRLCALAEAMTLKFFDDLFEPLGARPLGKQHCLQRIGVVGKHIRRGHKRNRSQCRKDASHSERGDSLCRR